jgi:hypothetical protein
VLKRGRAGPFGEEASNHIEIFPLRRGCGAVLHLCPPGIPR